MIICLIEAIKMGNLKDLGSSIKREYFNIKKRLNDSFVAGCNKIIYLPIMQNGQI